MTFVFLTAGLLAAFRDAFLAGQLVVTSGNAESVMLGLAGISPVRSDHRLAREVSVHATDEEVLWATCPRQPGRVAPSRELACAFNCGGKCII